MRIADVRSAAASRWIDVRVRENMAQDVATIECSPQRLRQVCAWLFAGLGCAFGGLVVEDTPAAWVLRYLFYGPTPGQIHVVTECAKPSETVPSISVEVHAADWHEREAEDLFGLVFEGHPRLGDFVLHNDTWPEQVAPMRRAFDPTARPPYPAPDDAWAPLRLVAEPGAFLMPVGPVYSGITESALFLLETVGEDVIRIFPRLFYNYRAIEKSAEGRTVDDALLLAERFSATSAFAHSLAFCRAVETISEVVVPLRAQALRVLLAELERLRHHAAAIEAICDSTALAVATSQAALLEEDLLRLSGALTGHRYLFGLNVPGGLARDVATAACREAAAAAADVLRRLRDLRQMVRFSTSFLDRIEGVGAIPEVAARTHGLVGPVARASGIVRDLRRAQPYAGYERLAFEVPQETAGDGYARLLVLFAEAEQSAALMRQSADQLSDGPVRVPVRTASGAAFGWAEAPRGATFHWVRIGEDGRLERYRAVTPSFINWHGLHLAAENFAFQDFPIILATLGLSAAECDR
ncbi:MAG TPA: NADH-quinone oxidoreductase subunit C [bacterium]|nr:NADH-quinone oxidoreductase subunit C [bacterium]